MVVLCFVRCRLIVGQIAPIFLVRFSERGCHKQRCGKDYGNQDDESKAFNKLWLVWIAAVQNSAICASAVSDDDEAMTRPSSSANPRTCDWRKASMTMTVGTTVIRQWKLSFPVTARNYSVSRWELRCCAMNSDVVDVTYLLIIFWIR